MRSASMWYRTTGRCMTPRCAGGVAAAKHSVPTSYPTQLASSAEQGSGTQVGSGDTYNYLYKQCPYPPMRAGSTRSRSCGAISSRKCCTYIDWLMTLGGCGLRSTAFWTNSPMALTSYFATSVCMMINLLMFISRRAQATQDTPTCNLSRSIFLNV